VLEIARLSKTHQKYTLVDLVELLQLCHDCIRHASFFRDIGVGELWTKVLESAADGATLHKAEGLQNKH
jgi:hypothetical protein